MRIYVAAASAELERARLTMNALRDAGYEITHDWTESVEVAGGVAMSATTLRQCALADYAGVVLAQALVLLVPSGSTSMGAWTELGIALAKDKEIYVSGPNLCIFQHMPRVRSFGSDLELLSWLEAG